jgi:dTDP-4-amino-4,6-dideoxygalactose transaminase
MGDTRVPFLDLTRQIRDLQPEIREALDRVCESGRIILGPAVERFERDFAAYCGVAHGVGVASGTDAIWAVLEALGIGAGDEVVTVSHTCVPTVAAILRTGATPVLVDVDPETQTMDPHHAEVAITDRTRCIVPVHIYGQCAEVTALGDLARGCDAHLVEDCAQAHGAEHGGRRAGSFGVAGCYSFYPTKNLGALGDGGMIVTEDAGLADELRRVRLYGYASNQTSVRCGYNSRLDELQAAVLQVGLGRLDEWNTRRREWARRYVDGLDDGRVHAPVEGAGNRHVYHLFVVSSGERASVREELEREGIETAIHYPVPVHRQAGYRERCRVGPGGLAVTERLSSRIFSLPLYPYLSEAELLHVVDVLASSRGKHPPKSGR